MNPTRPVRKRTAAPAISRPSAGDETEDVPPAAGGCGNPLALTGLLPGEVVLDLGSGGGIDALLSACRVGPTGKVYGLETNDEMRALAREGQARTGITNVEFRKGEIENIPLPDNSVDVVVSSSAINLSPDKPRVLAEAFRVLRPGGRLAVSDFVVRGSVAPRVRERVERWVGCLAGALEDKQFHGYLADAGFDAIEIEPAQVYTLEEMRALLADRGEDAEQVAQEAAGRFMSAFVRARKSGRRAQESAR